MELSSKIKSFYTQHTNKPAFQCRYSRRKGLMSEHATFPAAVHIVLHQKETNNILFQRRQSTKLYNGWLGLPAGHVDAGEHPIEAAIREAN